MEQLKQLSRGTVEIYTQAELAQRLTEAAKASRQMRIKLGLDPTSPDIHLGHTVVLRKMRQFQDLGHKAVLIIGDYTARIGDPTGQNTTRPMLTPEQIERNAKTYFEQAAKVLDTDPAKLEVRHNSEWLADLRLADTIRLAGTMTVARMLERDTFAKRQAEGREIFLHELLYPLMQGRDSVAIQSDVELGGTDQTFNNLCGRDLQRNAGQPPQIVMVMPLLIGTDGKNKMSKSLGNYIAVTDPPSEMFGKMMRIPDELMGNYFELLTDAPEQEIARLTDRSQINPRDAKEVLAKTIITQYHSAEAAAVAAEEFRRVHGGGSTGLPDEIPEVAVPSDKMIDGKISPVDLITHCLDEKSRSEARRLVAERGVRLNGAVIEDPNTPVAVHSGDILQRGKRRFVRLRLP